MPDDRKKLAANSVHLHLCHCLNHFALSDIDGHLVVCERGTDRTMKIRTLRKREAPLSRLPNCKAETQFLHSCKFLYNFLYPLKGMKPHQGHLVLQSFLFNSSLCYPQMEFPSFLQYRNITLHKASDHFMSKFLPSNS